MGVRAFTPHCCLLMLTIFSWLFHLKLKINKVTHQNGSEGLNPPLLPSEGNYFMLNMLKKRKKLHILADYFIWREKIKLHIRTGVRAFTPHCCLLMLTIFSWLLHLKLKKIKLHLRTGVRALTPHYCLLKVTILFESEVKKIKLHILADDFMWSGKN